MAGNTKAKSGHKPNLAAKKQRESYKAYSTRAKNKAKRVFKSNGVEAAKKYAVAHGLSLVWCRSQPWWREVK
jgi:hypothetical protein